MEQITNRKIIVMETSIYVKLLSFQMKIEVIKKDGENPFFKKANGRASTYATLPNILAEVKPILNELGLVITQPISSTEVSTIITDAVTGENLISSIPLPTNLNAQQMGSAITYFRRYTVSSLLSLEIDEDDDGNKASEVKKQETKTDEDNRPWLTEKMFSSSLERINSGEVDLYEKIDKSYKMKKEYRTDLKAALEKVKENKK
jgi:hypothetical protein